MRNKYTQIRDKAVIDGFIIGVVITLVALIIVIGARGDGFCY